MITIEPQVQALIFDCDGTLADTMPLHYLAWQETVQPFGAEMPEKLFYDLAGVPSDRMVAILNSTFGYRLDPAMIAQAKEDRFLQYLDKAQPIAPVVAIAKAYKGRLPMAVATGGVPPVIQSILAAIGLAGFFDTIVTAADGVRPKPAPDIFLEAARRLNVAPLYCQAFEDAELGLEAARQAGMMVTDVRPWRTSMSQNLGQQNGHTRET